MMRYADAATSALWLDVPPQTASGCYVATVSGNDSNPLDSSVPSVLTQCCAPTFRILLLTAVLKKEIGRLPTSTEIVWVCNGKVRRKRPRE